MLLLKQSYFTKKLQEGKLTMLGQLRDVQTKINEWYEEESKKIVIQARVDDVQESEKVSIFHHEQHLKHIKRSAILKLNTKEVGIIEGHKDCSNYLEKQVADLLLNPAELNHAAQAALLEEVDHVFTEADNEMLIKLPTKKELESVLSESNLDGITSLLYQFH